MSKVKNSTVKVPAEVKERWSDMTEANLNTEVRVEIAEWLKEQCKALEVHGEYFDNYLDIYRKVSQRHEADGYLTFENNCLRTGCDEKLDGAIRFLSPALADEIADCL